MPKKKQGLRSTKIKGRQNHITWWTKNQARTIMFKFANIPNKVFNFGFVPLILGAHLIVMLNINRSRSNAKKNVSYFNLFDKLLRHYFLQNGHVFSENYYSCWSNPTWFMHKKGGPSPCSLDLDAIPKLMIDRFIGFKKAKNTLFWNLQPCNVSPSFVKCDYRL